MITLRPATVADVPSVAVLLHEHKQSFLSDGLIIDINQLATAAKKGQLLVMVDAQDYPVGAVLFNDFYQDLHCTIGAMVNPKHWRSVLKAKLLAQAVDYAFETFNISKIKCTVMDSQSTAKKLLKRHHFRFVGIQYNEVYRNSIRENLCIYELKKGFWLKMKDSQ